MRKDYWRQEPPQLTSGPAFYGQSSQAHETPGAATLMHMQGLESSFQERGCVRKANRNSSSRVHATEYDRRLSNSRRIPPRRHQQRAEAIVAGDQLKWHVPDAGQSSAKVAWRLERGTRTRPAPSPGPQPQGNAPPFTHRSPRDRPKQMRERVEGNGTEFSRS